MSFWKKLFGGSASKTPETTDLPLAVNVAKNQSLDLVAADTVYAIIAVVPKSASEQVSEEKREEYVWAVYEAANPLMCRVLQKAKDVVRVYYFESSHLKVGRIPGQDHWFDAQEYYRLPDTYGSIIHFLDFREGRLRFRLQEPGKPESKFDVAVSEALRPIIDRGPRDVMLITVFKAFKPICIPTKWPLRHK